MAPLCSALLVLYAALLLPALSPGLADQTTEGNQTGTQTMEGNKDDEDKWNVHCRLPMKVGLCQAAIWKYYYNPIKHRCQQFKYGGCGSNMNNFETREECERKCKGVTGPVLPFESSPAPPLPVKPVDQLPAKMQCLASPDPGPCRAAFPKFYYDPDTSTCQHFIYGGCRGNQNRFDTFAECMEHCGGNGPVLPFESSPAPPLTVKPVDQLPAKSVVRPSAPGSISSGRTVQCLASPDPGPCRAAFPKFYYDSDTSTCQHFIYGGCRGNQNRFDTFAECMEHCGGNGTFDSHGKTRDRWTAGVFLFISLAAISALLLGALIITTLRRHRLPHRSSSISDKQELLPDDSSSVESLSMPAPRQA